MTEQTPPYGLLIFGVISLLVAIHGTSTGEAWARFTTPVYRDKEPKQFWRLVGVYWLGGVLFIGYFLYKVYGHSH